MPRASYLRDLGMDQRTKKRVGHSQICNGRRAPLFGSVGETAAPASILPGAWWGKYTEMPLH